MPQDNGSGWDSWVSMAAAPIYSQRPVASWEDGYITKDTIQQDQKDYDLQASAHDKYMRYAQEQSIAMFQQQIKDRPDVLDVNGRFKPPTAGVNYMLEGMTPEQVIQQIKSPVTSGSGEYGREVDQWEALNGVSSSPLLNTMWQRGPNTGGGFIGGLGRMVSGIGKVAPLRVALDAMTGGAAELGFAAGGLAAGDDPGTVLRNAAIGYAGGQVAGNIAGSVGGGAMGNMIGGTAVGLATGKNPMQALASGAMRGAATAAVDAGADPGMVQFASSATPILFGSGGSSGSTQQRQAPIKGSNFSNLASQFSYDEMAALIDAANSNRGIPRINGQLNHSGSDWNDSFA